MRVIEEREVFLCPFCGAPFREFIPAGVTQVKCRYCGAIILVPPRLGGPVQRCPNHPDVLAVGLCTSCGRSYCARCLHIMRVTEKTSGQLLYSYICPSCLEEINAKRVRNYRVWGLLYLAFGFFLLLFLGFKSEEAAGLLVCSFICWVFGVGFLGYSEYRRRYPWEAPETVYERNLRKQALQKMDVEEVYREILKSPEFWSRERLERKIKGYMLERGLSRDEAIREVALEVGLPKPPPKPPSPEEIVAAERRARFYGKITRVAALFLGVATVLGIAGAVYTHGVEIGTAECNWDALGPVSPGIHVMITPSDPRTMNKRGFGRYFVNQGSSDNFVSLVICGGGLCDIEFKGATFHPFMKKIKVKVTFYTCGRCHSFLFGGSACGEPHRETVTVFLGKLPPGSYHVVVDIYYGGAVYWVEFNGEWYRQTESGTSGGRETLHAFFTIY